MNHVWLLLMIIPCAFMKVMLTVFANSSEHFLSKCVNCRNRCHPMNPLNHIIYSWKVYNIEALGILTKKKSYKIWSDSSRKNYQFVIFINKNFFFKLHIFNFYNSHFKSSFGLTLSFPLENSTILITVVYI